jgi:hypothetical protein
MWSSWWVPWEECFETQIVEETLNGGLLQVDKFDDGFEEEALKSASHQVKKRFSIKLSSDLTTNLKDLAATDPAS